MTLSSAVVLLFLVIDPFGNVPFFVTALRRVPTERHRLVVSRELVIALGVMVGFLFLGGPMLKLLAISEPALSIAGGVILFLIAIRMVFPPTGRQGEDIEGEPFIVPLAVPYVAGPSVLATELLFMSREPESWGTWLLAVLIAWVASVVILLSGSAMADRLGHRGLIAMERLMGMILVAVAVQMLLNGLDAYRG